MISDCFVLLCFDLLKCNVDLRGKSCYFNLLAVNFSTMYQFKSCKKYLKQEFTLSLFYFRVELYDDAETNHP